MSNYVLSIFVSFPVFPRKIKKDKHYSHREDETDRQIERQTRHLATQR